MYVYILHRSFPQYTMGSLSNRQSILRPVSGRQAVAQLGLAQQPGPRPVSGRFLAAHLGVGRTRTASVDVLARRLPAPVAPEIAQFYRLRAQALRLQQQLAAHDARIKAASGRGLTPKEAGYPIPFLTPAEQIGFFAGCVYVTDLHKIWTPGNGDLLDKPRSAKA